MERLTTHTFIYTQLEHHPFGLFAAAAAAAAGAGEGEGEGEGEGGAR